MSETIALSYGYQLAALADMIGTQFQWPSPESGFALHVFQAAGAVMPIEVGETQLTEAHRHRLDEGPILAATGYRLACCECEPGLQADWSAGFARLTTRQPFPRDRESFFYRPLELLGICLGLRASAGVEPSHRQWLLDVVLQGESRVDEAGLWTQLLGACAADNIGLSWRLPRLPRAEECGLEELALLVWLQSVHPSVYATLDLGGRDADILEALLRQVVLAELPPFDISRAAIVHFAVKTVVERFVQSQVERHWQLGREARDSVELVRVLCSRFHLFALQIKKRHQGRQTISFQDEYDVQDALHALLRLHFDDVRAEEWTPSYAGNASRTDFLLKREQVVVETKVTRTARKKLDQRAITDQLIIDKERYRTHPDCKALVCFVYDPDHICENVAALESDVASEGPPLRVVVVVAPTGT